MNYDIKTIEKALRLFLSNNRAKGNHTWNYEKFYEKSSPNYWNWDEIECKYCGVKRKDANSPCPAFLKRYDEQVRTFKFYLDLLTND